MGNLSHWKFYEVGPIDRDSDPCSWRDKVTEFLLSYGAKVLDPTKKASSIGLEDQDSREIRKQYKENGEYDKLAQIMKKVISYDLRCVDESCIICRLDENIHTCGTYHELAMAELQRKPILVFSTSGKKTIPDWLFGFLELEHIFEDMEDMFSYLRKLDADLATDTTGKFKIL